MSLSLDIFQIDDNHPMWVGVKPGQMLSNGKAGFVRKSEWPQVKAQLETIATLRTMGVRVNVADDTSPLLGDGA